MSREREEATRTELPQPARETGTRAVQSRMPADTAATLEEIRNRVMALAEVAEYNRESQAQLLKENARLVRAVTDGDEKLEGKLDKVLADNTRLKMLNERLFRELQEFRYKLEQRMVNLERELYQVKGDMHELKARVDGLEGKEIDAERPTPDPSSPTDE